MEAGSREVLGRVLVAPPRGGIGVAPAVERNPPSHPEPAGGGACDRSWRLAAPKARRDEEACSDARCSVLLPLSICADVRFDELPKQRLLSMADEPSELVREHLRAIRAEIGAVREDGRETKGSAGFRGRYVFVSRFRDHAHAALARSYRGSRRADREPTRTNRRASAFAVTKRIRGVGSGGGAAVPMVGATGIEPVTPPV